MTAATDDKVIDEATAREALVAIERIERALDDAYQVIADSLGLRDRKAVEKHVKYLKDEIIKPYLDERGGELSEGDLAIRAYREVRGMPAKYDLVTLTKREGGNDAILAAAASGFLRVDNTGLERFRGSAGAKWADLIFSMREPPGATSALIIKRHGQ